jgi:hypothetical protein
MQHRRAAAPARAARNARCQRRQAETARARRAWSAACSVCAGGKGDRMHAMDFNNEKKWCPRCNAYVRYLMSVDHSFCAHCGTKVRLFSDEDSQRFNTSMERKKFKAS